MKIKFEMVERMVAAGEITAAGVLTLWKEYEVERARESDVERKRLKAEQRKVPENAGNLRNEAETAVAVDDPRTRLFREGLSKLAAMTGKGPDSCRSFIGKCLKAAEDNAIVVLGLIEDAERNRAADPASYIAARLKSRESGNGKPTIQDAAKDLTQHIAELNRRPSGIREQEGASVVRLLPPG